MFIISFTSDKLRVCNLSFTKIRILFVESSLELIPEELYNHPDVIKTCKRYGIPASRVILDKSLHYNAMSSLSLKWKRGRPDILHICLLIASDTPLVYEGSIELFFHILDGRVFKIRGGTRIPKHFERFKGVMADLLRNNKVPPISLEPLIFKVADNLEEFIGREGKLILLWEKGEPATMDNIVREALRENAIIGIGAFPHGDFEESTIKYAYRKYSVMSGRQLTAWGVTSRLICAIEDIISKATITSNA